MKTQLACDAIIFDIDNVLIDTRTSYLDTIRWTVDLFMTEGRVPVVPKAPKMRTPYFLNANDVETFKLLGGFNDDWDCCYGILTYLISIKQGVRSAEELRKRMDFKALTLAVKERPAGVSGIVKHLGRSSLVTIEKIRRIFQEVYLGPQLLMACEKRRPQSWKKRGLIFREKLIFRKPLLEQLKGMGLKLGIATGRSRFEAIYALKRFGVRELFDAITTMDEVKKAEREQGRSLRKPNPFSVFQTAKQLCAKGNCLYIGDLPDDVLAANRAKKEISIRSVGFPAMAHDMAIAKAALQAAGADILIEKAREILQHLK